MSLRRALYSLLLYLIFPLVIFRLFWRSRSNPAYRQRIGERLGLIRFSSDKPIIWVHAVSVGETIAAQPLIESLIKQYPDYRILVTTTTPTGSERVKALFGDRVEHTYFPYDLLGVVARFIFKVNPKILIVIETEIWPNLFSRCAKKNIPIILVNARLSERSTQKYLKVKSLVKETLEKMSMIAVRSSVDAERFKQLGAAEDQISVVGNIKFDFTVNKDQVDKGKQWRQSWQKNNFVWVVASTHTGEDELILDIYQNLLEKFPDLLLVIVPRHPERFDEVYLLCKTLSNCNVLRHSQVDSYEKHKKIKVNIILGDSMGIMQSWFAAADVVFMGGSLVKIGGHNPIEAIAQGVPVVTGPFMFNFDDITAQLSKEELLFIKDSNYAVEDQMFKLLEPRMNGVQNEFQLRAQKMMQNHQGVSLRLLHIITGLV